MIYDKNMKNIVKQNAVNLVKQNAGTFVVYCRCV